MDVKIPLSLSSKTLRSIMANPIGRDNSRTQESFFQLSDSTRQTIDKVGKIVTGTTLASLGCVLMHKCIESVVGTEVAIAYTTVTVGMSGWYFWHSMEQPAMDLARRYGWRVVAQDFGF